jgi:N-acetylmuramoyl-L-alanine amidase
MAEPVPYTVIHHGGTTEYCYDQASCAAIVRAYQDYHIDTNGFGDIAFNFVVGEDGNIYEGRGWGVVGELAPNYITRSIGICVIGEFTGEPFCTL